MIGTLTGTTNPVSQLKSNGNQGVLHIPQSLPSNTVIGKGLTPLQRCSKHILQSQPTEQPYNCTNYLY